MNKEYLTIFIIVVVCAFLRAQENDDIIPGEMILYTSCDIFKFPLKYSGAYISFPTDSTIQIDSLIFLIFSSDSKYESPYQRKIAKREIRSIEKIEGNNSDEIDRIYTDISKHLISIFGRYRVNFIKRLHDNFSYKDTVPRLWWNPRRSDSILVKDMNQNRHLLIKYDPKQDVQKLAKELIQSECILSADPNRKVRESKDLFYRKK